MLSDLYGRLLSIVMMQCITRSAVALLGQAGVAERWLAWAQAASKTNDTAGDGTTTATILSAAIIAEGMKIVAAGTNPIQVRALPPSSAVSPLSRCNPD